ncbi:MAG: hypothetical protein F4W95_13155 [Chloroflexi bacterium]|nr:hypothetical protein [Chloroflexota bacterium]MYD49417.1 hypothetical protein [Chloroflexota bacterium]
MTIKAVEEAIHYVRGWMEDDDGFWTYLDSNEMSTRYVLIDPILHALGWDTGDLYQCVVEHGKPSRADYVLFDANDNRDDNPVVIIESKNTGYRALNRLKSNPQDLELQLAKYTDGSTAKVGVLTNGLIWRLYDLDNSRRNLANQIVEPVINVYQDNAKISNRYIHVAAQTLHKYLGAHRFGW